MSVLFFFFFQAEDGIRDVAVTGVQTCALPISRVTTTRFPARREPVALATLPPHLFKNVRGASFKQAPCHVFAQLSALLRRSRGALTHIFRPVQRNHASLQNHLLLFQAGPSPDGNLASTLKLCQ